MGRLLQRRKLLLVPVLTILIVVGGNLLSTALRLDYYETSDRSRNLFAYQQSGLRADVILLGSSHTRDGIVANQVIDLLAAHGTPGIEAFDLSQPGASSLATEIALRKVIASNGCPAVVAVEVSPGSMNSGREKHDIPTHGARLADLPILLPGLSKAGAFNEFMGSQLHGLQQLFERVAHPPEPQLVADAFEKRGSFHGREAPGHRKTLPRGWEMRVRNVYLQSHWANYTVGIPQARALESVVARARECSADLLLYRMPNLTMRHHDIEQIEGPYADFMESFVARESLSYANLQWIDLGLQPGHFKDAGHLNGLGASIVTRHLTEQWLAPILSRR